MPRTSVPLDVYLDFLRDQFDVTMVEAFRTLLSDKPVKTGRKEEVPLDKAMRGNDLAPLTRMRQKAPGEIREDYFRPFDESVPRLFDLVVEELQGEGRHRVPTTDLYQTIFDTLLNAAAPLMMRSLDDHGLSSDILDNALDSIQVAPTRGIRDRCIMALLLLTATACLGSAAEGGQRVEAWYWGHYDQELFAGTDASVDPSHDIFDDGKPHIGLQRLNSDGTLGHRHTVEPEGTIIGSLPDTSGDFIADVDLSVTYEHLRIFEQDGHWYAEGLGSTMGTELQDGVTGKVTVVEPPAARQKPGETYPPVEIHAGDILRLGTTRFVVQRYSRGE